MYNHFLSVSSARPRQQTVAFRAKDLLTFACALFAAYGFALCQTTQLTAHDRPTNIDPSLWKRMLDIDARAGKIASLTAGFEQKKYTALLKKPLISSGTIRIKGSTMRWDTQQPGKSVLLVNEHEVRIFYPSPPPGVVEIYTVDQRMAELAASPLPRLAVLRQRFSFQPIATKELDESVDPTKFLAFSMKPSDPSLAQHIQDVRVLLDESAAYIVKAEMTDADGDRTVLQFTDVKVNADTGDLDLKIPAGAKVTRPLEGLNAAPGRG
jgi:outer membrane lipoprotein-sorting protein